MRELFAPQPDLPPHLAERTRILRDRPAPPADAAPRGEFVLLWLHHAVRAHENPALDVARLEALRRGLPLLVYQGLAGRHRFNSDRHHAFILQGARDCAHELAQRFPDGSVRSVFHLPADPAQPSPLPDLAARAALLVVEDFPAPPFPAWTDRLADRTPAPVWAVDCCCVVPMQLVGRPFDRAFAFRDKAAKLFTQRVARPWPELREPSAPAPPPSAAGVSLPFTPIDWAHADIPALIARCDIDHTIPPVAHTPGGSRAGYARWNAFKARGLRSYDKRRNNAAIPPDQHPVSRLSAYLHHGHVSPMRIAREAHEAMRSGNGGPQGEGAQKFLDELFVWREVAHNLCFHAAHEDPAQTPPRVETLSILPDWARQTLAAHANDPRRTLSWERLARAQTGDALWDLAQTSLLVQGELHNNVRMTWGKALLGWTDGPSRALEMLIDLNHRFALDGNNPNSFGGLLWCLGMFDRPFQPATPIYGTTRPRPTAEHAARLDMPAYRRIVAAPAGGKPMEIAIIGAGIAGLTCARTLADQGLTVRVYDKGRGPGGRLSRRRHTNPEAGGPQSGGPAREWHFDHGAQYFTARDPAFRRVVESWMHEGLVAPWPGRLVAIEDGARFIDKAAHPVRYVGVPGMHAVAQHLAETMPATCTLRSGVRVAVARRLRDGWELESDQGEPLGRADALVVATPAPQAAGLLADVPDLAAQADAVEMAPCWALMLGFDAPLPAGPAGAIAGAFVNRTTGPASRLSWIARNTAKPGRPADAECWVAHATGAWTQGHLEQSPEDVRGPLTEAFFDALGLPPVTPAVCEAHRWRYAIVDAPLNAGCLFDASAMVAACGDWCGAARVEGAYLSGAAAAGRLLGQLAHHNADGI